MLPCPPAAAADPANARGYRWAAGEGAFLPLPAVLLDNQNRGGRAGVHAYRVFQPRAEHATPLLVDLGWLPLPGDRRLPDVPRPPAIPISPTIRRRSSITASRRNPMC